MAARHDGWAAMISMSGKAIAGRPRSSIGFEFLWSRRPEAAAHSRADPRVAVWKDSRKMYSAINCRSGHAMGR